MDRLGQTLFYSCCISLLLLTSAAQAQPAAAPPMVGVGMTYIKDSVTGKFTIQSVVPGNAAAVAELRAGDRMIAVDGVALENLPAEKIKLLLRGGEANKPYTLSIERTIKTSLGLKDITKDVLLTPREVSTRTCLEGDCMNGTGKMLRANGYRFEGKFVNEMLVSGKVFYPSGRIFTEGTLENGLLNGENCKHYFDRAENNLDREGTFVKGMLRKGILHSKDGKSTYNGEWDEDGNFHGDKVKVSGPWWYNGPVVHGKYTGNAEMSYLSGRYEGPVVDKKPQGKGKYYEGSYKYIGYFSNGLMEGKFRRIQKSKGGNYENILEFRAGVEQ